MSASSAKRITDKSSTALRSFIADKSPGVPFNSVKNICIHLVPAIRHVVCPNHEYARWNREGKWQNHPCTFHLDTSRFVYENIILFYMCDIQIPNIKKMETIDRISCFLFDLLLLLLGTLLWWNYWEYLIKLRYV